MGRDAKKHYTGVKKKWLLFGSLTVIDECSQALEMACWVAVPWAGKLLLAGDHLQLPPTILSTKVTIRDAPDIQPCYIRHRAGYRIRQAGFAARSL